MALSTGSAIVVRDTPITAISSATSIVAGGFSVTADSVIVSSTAPLADAVLQVTTVGTVSAGEVFHLYRRDMNVVGTNDASIPTSGYKSKYMGSFMLELVTTTHYITLTDIPLAPEQEFYIQNDTVRDTTGTTVLTIIPKSFNVV